MILVIAGASNAVNLTDGLDGLAIGLMIIAAGAMTILSYVSGHREFAQYLEIVRLPGAAELTIFCGAMTGPPSASFGTTHIRRKSSWATWERFRWAEPSASSPC